MGGDPKSIDEIQEAESKASKLVEDAKKERDRMLADAKEKAAKMISDAEASAKDKRIETLKAAVSSLEQEKRVSVEHAMKSSHKIKEKKLGVREKELIVKKLADMILGA